MPFVIADPLIMNMMTTKGVGVRVDDYATPFGMMLMTIMSAKNAEKNLTIRDHHDSPSAIRQLTVIVISDFRRASAAGSSE